MTKHVSTAFDRYGSDEYFRVAKNLSDSVPTLRSGTLKEIETGIRYFMRKYRLKASEILDFKTAFRLVEERSDQFENGLADLGFLSKFQARCLDGAANRTAPAIENDSSISIERLFTEGPLAYFSWECPKEKIVDATSPNVERVLGRTPDYFSSERRSYFELIHPDDVEAVRKGIEGRVDAMACEFDLHYRIVRPGGNVRFVRDHTRVEYAPDGRIIRSYGFVIDVTDREESLFLVDEYVRAVDQSAIVQIVDREGIILYANDFYREVSGDSREIVGKPVRILGGKKFHGQDFWADLWSTVLEGKIWSGVVQNPLPNDPSKSYYAHTTITPICNTRGEYDRFIAIKFDVTRLKEVESALRKANSRFEKIIDSTSQGFWSLDRNLRIREVNSALCRMLGYDREDLVGHDVREFFDEKNRAVLDVQAKNIVSTEHRNYDVEILKKDGSSLPITITATTLRDDGGNFSEAVAFVADSTEAKAFQSRLYLASITDELTQIGNRRHFDGEFSESFQALRDGKMESLSLIIFDIDNFKRVNDSFWHDAGDKVLRFIGNRLKSLSDPRFPVFRIGGEEFWIIGKGIPLYSMRSVAEELRKDLQWSAIDIGKPHPLRISISAGVASLDSSVSMEKTADDLYRSTDALLYLAKNSGRNNVKSQGDL